MELDKMTNSGKSKRYLFLIYFIFWQEKFISISFTHLSISAATTLI